MTLSRRTILTHGAALAAAATLPSTEASAATVQRPNVSSLAPNHPILVSYRTAINAMKQLPANDPRNWTKQAQIHNGNNVVRCPHGNWYFLPWHRAYLLAFEKICRQLSNNPNFALPYWDWTANPQLPAAFASPTFNNQPNALFNNTRSSQTVTIPSNVAGSQRMAQILAETTFEIFGSSKPNGQNNTSQPWQIAPGTYGPLESGPHNYVHGAIGGNMGSFMSPLDPIFWLHHCNIDRIWDQWNRMGRLNTTNPLWRNFSFNNQFVVPSGNGTAPFNVAPSALLNIQQLGYRYVPPLFFPAQLLVAKPAIELGKLVPVVQTEAATAPVVAKLNTQLSLSVKLNQTQAAQLKKIDLITPAAAPATESTSLQKASINAPGRVLAFIRNVQAPSKGNTEVRVFVNCPYLTSETSPQDEHYAGSFTFFGGDEHAGHDGQTYLFDLTETVRRLRTGDSDVTDNVNVQLMPVPIPGVPSDNLEFKVGSIDIAII
jgi:tyrosinase